jgi:hypothetical protein
LQPSPKEIDSLQHDSSVDNSFFVLKLFFFFLLLPDSSTFFRKFQECQQQEACT